MLNSYAGVTFGVGSRKVHNQVPLLILCYFSQSTAGKALSRIEQENDGEQIRMVCPVAQYYGRDVNAMNKYTYIQTKLSSTPSACAVHA
jgi:hypothetical protein